MTAPRGPRLDARLAEIQQAMLERLAAWDHRAWANWTRHMLDNLTPENIARWRRQIDTAYSELSSREQELDRREAREIAAIVAEHGEVTYWRQEIARLHRTNAILHAATLARAERAEAEVARLTAERDANLVNAQNTVDGMFKLLEETKAEVGRLQTALEGQTWECGCGAINGVNLAVCRVCRRHP